MRPSFIFFTSLIGSEESFFRSFGSRDSVLAFWMTVVGANSSSPFTIFSSGFSSFFTDGEKGSISFLMTLASGSLLKAELWLLSGSLVVEETPPSSSAPGGETLTEELIWSGCVELTGEICSGCCCC